MYSFNIILVLLLAANAFAAKIIFFYIEPDGQKNHVEYKEPLSSEQVLRVSNWFRYYYNNDVTTKMTGRGTANEILIVRGDKDPNKPMAIGHLIAFVDAHKNMKNPV